MKKISKFWLLLFIGLFLFSCSTTSTMARRIRALEQRLEIVETKELANKEVEKLAQKLNRGLNLFSQRIDNIYNDQAQNLSNLEELTRQLGQLEKEVKKLILNQEKLLQKLE